MRLITSLAFLAFSGRQFATEICFRGQAKTKRAETRVYRKLAIPIHNARLPTFTGVAAGTR